MQKVILITGASSGIGKASANYFADRGWKVIATMRNPEKEEELLKKENVFVTKLDVEDEASIQAAIEKGIAQFGHIDALLNNAGYGQFGIFEATSREKMLRQFSVNVFGVMDTVRAILPHFRARKQGLIMNVSSGAGKFTLPTLSLYSSSKFALEGFSEALFFELSELNIKVKIIEPGGTETGFNKAAGETFAADPALEDYQPFLEASGKLFQEMIDAKSVSAEQVAETIYTAATDGTNTVRYVIGNADFMKRIAARTQMPDQEYIDTMRKGYTKYMPQ